MSFPPIDVLIIEDQRLFGDVIRLTLERLGMTVVAVAESVEAGRTAIDRLGPQLVLLDLGLPDGDGFALGVEILERYPHIKVVAVTATEDPRIVRESIQLGFSGYISKSLTAAAFARSLESILDGQLVAPQSKGRSTSGQDHNAAGDVAMLTPREREVLALLAKGATSDEIATALSISRHTVRTHIQSILEKLHVHSRLQAAALALRDGLLGSRTSQG